MTQTRGNLTCMLAIADVMAGELEDENERLRAKVKRQAAELTSMREALEQRNDSIRFYKRRESRYILESVELRKLVRDMWNCLAPSAMGGSRVELRKLANRMRKLGILED